MVHGLIYIECWHNRSLKYYLEWVGVSVAMRLVERMLVEDLMLMSGLH